MAGEARHVRVCERFAENRIDFTVLPDLIDQDLKDIGVVLGDRRKILRARTPPEAPERRSIRAADLSKRGTGLCAVYLLPLPYCSLIRLICS